MPYFRKKPVVIEAERVPEFPHPPFEATGGCAVSKYVEKCIALAEWCGGVSHMMRNEEDFPNDPDYVNHILISTLEGDMKALPGDWIIKGISGEFYPCKPDIFEATYELVDEGVQIAMRMVD